MEKKVLVAYFSYSGTTKGYAEKIAKQACADLFEIQAAQPLHGCRCGLDRR